MAKKAVLLSATGIRLSSQVPHTDIAHWQAAFAEVFDIPVPEVEDLPRR